MISNFRYLVFLVAGIASSLTGAAESITEFIPYLWIPFLAFVYLNNIVDRYQYVALQIAKVCIKEKAQNPGPLDIQILHENLIPNWVSRIYLMSCVMEYVSFFLLLFTQGWIAVIISYGIFIGLGIVSSFIPFLKKDYYSKQIERIQDYVEIHTMKFQQQIGGCSVNVNEVKETLNKVAASANPNNWFVERLQNS